MVIIHRGDPNGSNVELAALLANEVNLTAVSRKYSDLFWLVSLKQQIVAESGNEIGFMFIRLAASISIVALCIRVVQEEYIIRDTHHIGIAMNSFMILQSRINGEDQ